MTYDDWLMVFKIGVLLTWLLFVPAFIIAVSFPDALRKLAFVMLALSAFALAVVTFDSIAAGVW